MTVTQFKAPCGCQIWIPTQQEIEDKPSLDFCPLHQSAGEMLEALKDAIKICAGRAATKRQLPVDYKSHICFACKPWQEAIAKAEGKQ